MPLVSLLIWDSNTWSILIQAHLNLGVLHFLYYPQNQNDHQACSLSSTCVCVCMCGVDLLCLLTTRENKGIIRGMHNTINSYDIPKI